MPCAGSDGNCNARVKRIWIVLREAIAHRRQRRSLSELDTRLTRDVGLSEEDVDHETGKRFWE